MDISREDLEKAFTELSRHKLFENRKRPFTHEGVDDGATILLRDALGNPVVSLPKDDFEAIRKLPTVGF